MGLGPFAGSVAGVDKAAGGGGGGGNSSKPLC